MKRTISLIATLLLAWQAVLPMALQPQGGAQGSTTERTVDQKTGNVTETTKNAQGETTKTETWERDAKGNVTHKTETSDGKSTEHKDPPDGKPHEEPVMDNSKNPPEPAKGSDGKPYGKETTEKPDGSYKVREKDKDGNETTTEGKKDASGKDMGKKTVTKKPKKGKQTKEETEYDDQGNPKKTKKSSRRGDSSSWTTDEEWERKEEPKKNASFDNSGSVQGLVLPNEIHANEPFTFAAQGVVEGEVIQIQTVDGQVVCEKKADNLGRVFVPAAMLATGIYKVLQGTGTSAKPCGQMTIGNPASQVSSGVRSLMLDPVNPMRIGNPASISGQGFCPDASKMNVSLGSQPANVLAATGSEMKLAPIATQPGMNNLAVQNTNSGQNASTHVMCYSLSGKLSQQRVLSGSQTMLNIAVEPKTMSANVNASIASGPVDFGGGNRKMTIPVRNGMASVPLFSQPGSAGAFRVAFDLVSFVNQDGNKVDWEKRDDGTSKYTEYDKGSRLLHEYVMDADGNTLDDTQWEYDAKGRMRKKVHRHWNPDGTVTEETKTWDENHKLTSSTSETYKSGR